MSDGKSEKTIKFLEEEIKYLSDEVRRLEIENEDFRFITEDLENTIRHLYSSVIENNKLKIINEGEIN